MASGCEQLCAAIKESGHGSSGPITGDSDRGAGPGVNSRKGVLGEFLGSRLVLNTYDTVASLFEVDGKSLHEVRSSASFGAVYKSVSTSYAGAVLGTGCEGIKA